MRSALTVFTFQVDLTSTRHDPLRWPRAKLRTGVRNLIGNRRYDQLRTYLLK